MASFSTGPELIKLGWDKLANPFLDWLGQEAKKKWLEGVRWPEAELQYRTQLYKLYRFTKLFKYMEEIDIQETYIDLEVYKLTAGYGEADLTTLQAIPTQKESLSPRPGGKSQPFLRQVIQNKRVYLQGKPGAGKTTFFKYLTLKACDGTLRKTPIFISLDAMSSSKDSFTYEDLISYIEQQFMICEFPEVGSFVEYLLRHGDVIVFFDGLDEVMTEQGKRGQVINALEQFSNTFLGVHICISCRTATKDKVLDRFEYYEVADFNNVQKRLFANKWFQKKEETLSNFLDEFEKKEHARIRGLARTPLLMVLLCYTFDKTGRFPARRKDLYEKSFNVLLQEWDESRQIEREKVYKELSYEGKIQLLSELAHKNFSQGQYYLRENELVKQIEEFYRINTETKNISKPQGKVVIQAIEEHHGLLVKQGHQIYTFSHLSIQEYFTALHIAEKPDERVPSLIRNHVSDKRWREVILMVASLIDDIHFFDLFTAELENEIWEIPFLLYWVDENLIFLSSRGIDNRTFVLLTALIAVRIVSSLEILALHHSIQIDVGNFGETYGFELAEILDTFVGLVEIYFPKKQTDIQDAQLSSTEAASSFEFMVQQDHLLAKLESESLDDESLEYIAKIDIGTFGSGVNRAREFEGSSSTIEHDSYNDYVSRLERTKEEIEDNILLYQDAIQDYIGSQLEDSLHETLNNIAEVKTYLFKFLFNIYDVDADYFYIPMSENVSEYLLSQEQIDKLKSYTDGLCLFLECLSWATVDDKESIMANVARGGILR